MKEEQEPRPESELETSSSVLGSLWNIVRNAVVAILITLGGLFLLVQVPFVQNWLVNKVTAALSQTLQTTVSIDYLRLTFFDEFRLEGLYIEDFYGDTLLYSKDLRTDIVLNPFVIARRGLVVEEVKLVDTRMHIRRLAGEYQDNLQQMLQALFPPDSTRRERRPFSLDLGEINLTRVRFSKDDLLKGSRIDAFVSRGAVVVNRLDIPNKVIRVRTINLVDPVVAITNTSPSEQVDSLLAIDMRLDSLFGPIDTTYLDIAVGQFYLNNGAFDLHNYRQDTVKTTPDDQLDYKHLEVDDIGINISNFHVRDWHFEGRVNNITARESSGFVLNELSADSASVSGQGIYLAGLNLVTPHSTLGDTLVFRYDEYIDFAEFPDEVAMDLRFNNAQVAVRDILTFAPGLSRNPFFSSNRDQRLNLDGRIRGPVNNLSGRDLNIQLAGGTRLVGNFSSRNLAVRNEEFLSLRLEQLRTSVYTLRQIIPGFNPPANFDRLGTLNFSGSFDGFFVDFVADGLLSTNLGEAEMDMQMRLANGLENALYAGALRLEAFDLGRWTGNPNFGTVTLQSEVEDGRGLTPESASATLSSTVDQFQFKGYDYQNAQLQGRLELNQFDGVFTIADENIDLNFQGSIDLSAEVPEYRFNAQVEQLDLLALNLSETDVQLSGAMDLNLRNRRLADLRGQASFTSFEVRHNQDRVYRVDTLLVISNLDSLGNREFIVDSEIMQARLEGNFDIQQVPEILTRYLDRNHPGFAHHLNIRPSGKAMRPAIFDFDLHLADSRGLQRLVSESLGGLRDVRLRGSYDGPQNALQARLSLPRLTLGNWSLRDILLQVSGEGSEGEIDFAVDSTVINQKTGFAPIVLIGLLDGDALAFDLNYAGGGNGLVDQINLNGRLTVLDTNYMELNFDQSNLVLMEKQWDIEEPNFIRFGNNTLATQNINLRRADRTISLEHRGKRGLRLQLRNFNFDYIDEIWDYDPLDFGGTYQLVAEVGDVFQMQDLRAHILSDTMYINGDDWGYFSLDAEAPDLQHPFQGYMSLTKDTSQLIAKGFYNPQDAPGDNLREDQRQHYFDFSVHIAGFPLRLAEYFIGETVQNTVGQFDADLRFFGLPPDTNAEGMIHARNGAVTVDFLQTRYRFDRSEIVVNNELFDASGTILRDKFGHRAVLSGGVSHNNLKDLGFDATLTTDRFLALDTEKGDNTTFYGQAIGRGFIQFTGSFKRPDIYINATVGDSTRLTIPVDGGAGNSELSFIRFVDKNAVQRAPVNTAELRGVALEMDLQITEAAVVRIVFDEQAGDVIQGSGNGNIRMLVPRSSDDFQMFGEYTISRGDYLFTLYNVVNKSFRIRQGGTIQWEGDPFAAEINIAAEYRGLNASVANFIAEYLVNADAELKNQASQATEVNLVMQLRGELLQPIINFDINFPSLRGQLQNLTDSKLRLLKQDQNELNKQVFGLIVAGQFIPTDINTFTGSEIIYNTVSEFVSNQLSLLLTELFSELIEEGNVLSGIDFDIAYSQYQSVDLGEGQNINRGDELQVRLRQNFFNDRLSILVGGNIDMGTTATPTATEATGAFVGNDLIIEYVLNKDRSLKLRVYQLLEPDIGGGRRLEVGTGLSYRKEFESFNDFLKSLQRSVGLSRKKDKPDS